MLVPRIFRYKLMFLVVTFLRFTTLMIDKNCYFSNKNKRENLTSQSTVCPYNKITANKHLCDLLRLINCNNK